MIRNAFWFFARRRPTTPKMESAPKLVKDGEEPDGIRRANSPAAHLRERLGRECHGSGVSAKTNLLQNKLIELRVVPVIKIEEENGLHQPPIRHGIFSQVGSTLRFELLHAPGNDST